MAQWNFTGITFKGKNSLKCVHNLEDLGKELSVLLGNIVDTELMIWFKSFVLTLIDSFQAIVQMLSKHLKCRAGKLQAWFSVSHYSSGWPAEKKKDTKTEASASN